VGGGRTLQASRPPGVCGLEGWRVCLASLVRLTTQLSLPPSPSPPYSFFTFLFHACSALPSLSLRERFAMPPFLSRNLRRRRGGVRRTVSNGATSARGRFRVRFGMFGSGLRPNPLLVSRPDSDWRARRTNARWRLRRARLAAMGARRVVSLPSRRRINAMAAAFPSVRAAADAAALNARRLGTYDAAFMDDLLDLLR